MIVHSQDKDISQKEIKDMAARSVIFALASYFNVTEKKMEIALRNMVRLRKTEVERDADPITDFEGYRETEDNRLNRQRREVF